MFATPPEFDAFAARLGRLFVDRELLARSLAHRSWCAENGGESNERLEFLGDAVLGLIVTAHIYRRYPALPEGDLAKLRASVVNAVLLARMAEEVGIGPSLLLGKGEDATGGREKASILADALEAVIGAVYLDGGWDAAEELVMRLVGPWIIEYAEGPGGQDYKTRLQEFAARSFEQLPAYRVSDQGPDHAKVFAAVVLIGGRSLGTGSGRSKKQAEQAAAKMAWEQLSIEAAGAAEAPGAGGVTGAAEAPGAAEPEEAVS